MVWGPLRRMMRMEQKHRMVEEIQCWVCWVVAKARCSDGVGPFTPDDEDGAEAPHGGGDPVRVMLGSSKSTCSDGVGPFTPDDEDEAEAPHGGGDPVLNMLGSSK